MANDWHIRLNFVELGSLLVSLANCMAGSKEHCLKLHRKDNMYLTGDYHVASLLVMTGVSGSKYMSWHTPVCGKHNT